MSFWRKKTQIDIPPVDGPQFTAVRIDSASSLPLRPQSNANVLRKPPSTAADPHSLRDSEYRKEEHRPPRQKGAGDVYSRGEGDLAEDRNALFAGYKPKEDGKSRFFDDNDGRPSSGAGEDEGEESDTEGIKKKSRGEKVATLESSGRGVTTIRDTVQLAEQGLYKIHEQGGRLGNTNLVLTGATSKGTTAEGDVEDMSKLNRSIFRPARIRNKEGDLNAARAAEEKERLRQAGRMREAQSRLAETESYAAPAVATRSDRKRYQFEATASDDEMEDEIDNNLDEISSAVGRLRVIASAMGTELEKQNAEIDKLSETTETLDGKLSRVNRKLKKIT